MDVQDEEIVISGINGCFPNCDSVKQLRESLFNKVDLISDDDRRWKHTHPEIPQRSGKMNHINKFDASFFGVHYKEAHSMDPGGRILLEKTYECLIDAGINPKELQNTRTGVFVGECFTESEKQFIYDMMQVNEHGFTGCSRSMLASRVANWLGVIGPAYNVDTACSSSLYAMDHALKSIREGLCDAALVCGVNLCLNPHITLQAARLGVLSPDGRCNSFSEDANGYVRSEAVVVCLLQKAKHARRAHCQVIHVKTNCDGYKDKGITYPSGQVQRQLLQDFYNECGVSPSSVEFVEAHGTGTFVGDPEELSAIDGIFCTGRSEPLLIGSVKSNLGHTEPSSALCSISKVIIAYSTGYIPPNINLSRPRQINEGLPCDDLPRLVCVSGRTESAVARILDDLESHPVDVDQVRLWHAIHEQDIAGHNFRGFVLLQSTKLKSIPIARDVQHIWFINRPVEFLYSNVEVDWHRMASQLLKIRPFATAISRCEKPLASKGINLVDIISKPFKQNEDRILLSLVGTIALQIGLTEVLRNLSIEPDLFAGHGFGELCCAYADDCLTIEETIKVAYDLGEHFEAIIKQRSIFLVKLCYEQVHLICPATVTVAYHNNPDDCTISGLTNDVASFVTVLKSKEIMAKELSKINIANSPAHFKNTGFFKELREKLQSVALHRSQRWVTQASPQEGAQNGNTKYDTNVKLSTNMGLQNAILIEFSETMPTIPKPKTNVIISLSSTKDDYLTTFLTSLGKLFEVGLNPRLANIYPHVAFPVAQSTPMLAHLIEWQHSEDWFVCSIKPVQPLKISERLVRFSLQDENKEFIAGHLIDGRIIIPATNYIVMVWETLAMKSERQYTEVSVVFENVCMHRDPTVSLNDEIEFIVTIHDGSGHFEITEKGELVATGRVYEKKNIAKDYRVVPLAPRTEKNTPDAKPMTLKDCTKELNLRGYRSTGAFHGVLECSIDGSRGSLLWEGNWVTFLDTMLHFQLIVSDTRALYVPTRFDELSIDVDRHNDIIAKMDPKLPEKSIECLLYQAADIIRAGGVQIIGKHVVSLSKKSALGIPVYERNEFVPNYNMNIMKMEDILRVNLQLILETVLAYKFKTIEIIDEEYNINGLDPVIELVDSILGDLPLVQAELIVFTKKSLKLNDKVTVSNKSLSEETNTTLFIGANLLTRLNVLQEAASTLKEKCFILSREKSPPPHHIHKEYDIVTYYNSESECFVLLRKKLINRIKKYIKITTEDETFSWIKKVKEVMREGHNVVLYNENEPVNGLLGLVNCLRQEPGGDVVTGVLISDPTAPGFDPNLQFYKEQLDKELPINVYLNGKWGTYRHLLIRDLHKKVSASHAFVNVKIIGDLSSLSWWEGPFTETEVFEDPMDVLIHVYYSALNFGDVMTAMGRVSVDAVSRGRIQQEYVQGIEVAGKTSNGNRVMAICLSGISTLVKTLSSVTYSIPDEWTLEEAATVPVAYATAYLSLVLMGKMRHGESVLVHAGSGGVGQAAINVALHHGLEVFTTVGTPAKKAFIKRLFPQLKDSHIGNSRDTSFEELVLRVTNGRGVDLVLNSLSDDKLQASVNCLARGGRFLEIGKYDIGLNTELQMCFIKKEASFHGVMLDYISDKQSSNIRKNLQTLIIGGIASGAVRPLTYYTFETDEVEPAYRFMAAGKHIGKVLIKIRDENSNVKMTKPISTVVEASPRYWCSRHHTYLLVGGLGGFGMELADWLVLRGARKLMLTTRRGISNGYQSRRIRIWESYGVEVRISTHDVTKEEDCIEMLKEACLMGPVKAVFNLAVVLNDAVFENQDSLTFKTSFDPKAKATMNLDKLTRTMCPELKDFVVFSSFSCGRGNAGQTNYGYANSVMERICEIRLKMGYPALAIQWGAIGDVGLVADTQTENVQIELGGTLQQRITSCLESLDLFLKQKAPIVSSIVVAEKRTTNTGGTSVLDAVARIMSMADIRTVSKNVPLSDLGMDSMSAVEIKLTLEREFELFLSAQEIRMLTLASLTELLTQSTNDESSKPTTKVTNTIVPSGLELLMRNFGSEEQASEPFVYLPTKEQETLDSRNVIYMLPGVESCASVLEPLCQKLNSKACVMQLGLDHNDEDLQQMADRLYTTVKDRLLPQQSFCLLGYSFGCLPILQLAAMLEDEGYKGVVFCLDGSPDYIHSFLTNIMNFNDDFTVENHLIIHTVNILLPKNSTIIPQLIKKLKTIESYDDRIRCAIEMCPKDLKYTEKFITEMSKAIINRLKVGYNHNKMNKKLKSPIVLLRPKINPSYINCSDSYGLENVTENTVSVHCIEADHISIVDNVHTAEIINSVIASNRLDKIM
ncbi:fatty acid synthase-like [Pectinophora gossypiella]|uniref:fatty acid synthase-like n=1 Tax=Pectinophora gossypiella TaxID=13191 RepID=UPI00214E7C3B|nr:fatty acid synthase-like [Pectinophora gossypiella]